MSNGRLTDISVCLSEPGMIRYRVPGRVLEGLDFKSYAIHGAVTITGGEGTLRTEGDMLTANGGTRSGMVKMPLEGITATLEKDTLTIDMETAGVIAEFTLQGFTEAFELKERVRECVRKKQAA